AEGNSAALTMRSQLWNNCEMCHQVFLRSAAKKHVSITAGSPPPRLQATVTLAGLEPVPEIACGNFTGT
ncbi:MAG: hypothetical protein LBK44_02535, partial [Spirochaetales bacterium]|nr:hypothetical protein [Spirochaetales bacterium]